MLIKTSSSLLVYYLRRNLIQMTICWAINNVWKGTYTTLNQYHRHIAEIVLLNHFVAFPYKVSIVLWFGWKLPKYWKFNSVLYYQMNPTFLSLWDPVFFTEINLLLYCFEFPLSVSVTIYNVWLIILHTIMHFETPHKIVVVNICYSQIDWWLTVDSSFTKGWLF